MQIKPDWRLMHQFVIENTQKAMSKDDSTTARPMTITDYIADPKNLYGYTVYIKGNNTIFS